MGEFRCAGRVRRRQALTTNDASALAIGQVQYSLLCYPEGGIVDDLTLYRLSDQHYMLTVNASNIDKDWAWVTGHGKGADWKNVSDETGLLAVQGPKAEGLVQRLADQDVTGVPYYHFVSGKVAGVPCLISRTGYTGEDGFELYAPAARLNALWDGLMNAGKPDGIQPIGLGARDTLRLEMKFALYGNDIDETTNPLEAGLGWVEAGQGEFMDAVRSGHADRGCHAQARGLRDGRARRGAPWLPCSRTTRRHRHLGPLAEPQLYRHDTRADVSAIGTEFDVEIRGQAQRARAAKSPFVPSHAKKI
jgi:aminomethyltransferase